MKTLMHGCAWLLLLPVFVMLVSCESAPSQAEGTGGVCVPVGERAGREFGCFILATQTVGVLGDTPVYWHISRFPTREAAVSAAPPSGTVVEAFDTVWLYVVAPAGSLPTGGERVAAIGPLPLRSGISYSAQYMEATFQPGMQTRVHRHPGPEAWYTISGEMCLETPEGAMVGRAGGEPVIVREGLPMQLTATGTDVRRGLVLVLHTSSDPASVPASDWQPTGLCKP
jgi:quercetin dioxygenase-like cupin family protein